MIFSSSALSCTLKSEHVERLAVLLLQRVAAEEIEGEEETPVAFTEPVAFVHDAEAHPHPASEQLGVAVRRVRPDPSPIPVEGPVHAPRRIDRQRRHLLPEAALARGLVVEDQAGELKGQLPESDPSHGRADVVIERRPVNLAEVFPDEASQGREGDRGPVVQPVRASGVEVDVSVVRMSELVGR